MKKNLSKVLATLIALVLFTASAFILCSYSKPMDDRIYDLSLMSNEPDSTDEKGWTVFTREEDSITKLTRESYGSYSGLSFAGQTFYYSRILTEELDMPILKIIPVDRMFAVFLDEELLYTDCPELDNRIGALLLPMHGLDRNEPISISLPEDYLGKTLTIAQSSPEISDGSSTAIEVFPSPVTLSCAFAYESSLIAESFRTAIPITLFFIAGAFLLAAFVWQILHDEFDVSFLCISLTAFMGMCIQLPKTSFFSYYYQNMDSNFSGICYYFMIAALLVLLSSRGGRFRTILWSITGIYLLSVILYLAADIEALTTSAQIYVKLPPLISFFGLLTALLLGVLFWRKENPFYHFFTPFTITGILIYIMYAFFSPKRKEISEQFLIGLQSLTPDYFLRKLSWLMLLIGTSIEIIYFFRRNAARRLEKKLLKERSDLIHSSYQNLCRHHEEVMILRHDMNKHLLLLRQMTQEASVAGYIDELIGQNTKIRPIIQSGNEILDIILNGKLGIASDAGIKIDIIRSEAPEKIPLSDADLCSLIMNLLDNAVTAASGRGIKVPYIRLDLHIKNNFFVFTCENAANIQKMKEIEKNDLLPKHGLGLKIVQQIAKRYDCLCQTEYGKSFYKTTLAIPLTQASR